MDRRGLVASGQLKPPSDETIRYGRLLFSETLEDYYGWEGSTNSKAGDRVKGILGGSGAEQR